MKETVLPVFTEFIHKQKKNFVNQPSSQNKKI